MGRPIKASSYVGWVIHRLPSKPTEIYTVECDTCGSNTKKAKCEAWRIDHKIKCSQSNVHPTINQNSIIESLEESENLSPNRSQLSERSLEAKNKYQSTNETNTGQLTGGTPLKKRHLSPQEAKVMFNSAQDSVYLYLACNDRNLQTEKFYYLEKAFKTIEPEFPFPRLAEFEEISKRAFKQVNENLSKQEFYPYLMIWGKKFGNSYFLVSALQSKTDLSYGYVHCEEISNYSSDLLNIFCHESLQSAKNQYKVILKAMVFDFQNYEESAKDFFENKPDSAYIKAKSFSMLIKDLSKGGMYVTNSEEKTRLDEFFKAVDTMKKFCDDGTSLAEAMHSLFLFVMNGTMSVKLDYEPVFKDSRKKIYILMQLIILEDQWEELGYYRMERGKFKTFFDMSDVADPIGFWNMAASEGFSLHKIAKELLKIPAIPKQINLDEIYKLKQEYPLGIGDTFKSTVKLWLQSCR